MAIQAYPVLKVVQGVHHQLSGFNPGVMEETSMPGKNQRGGEKMPFQDQTLKCQDCGKDFVWTASEQEFYQQKGFTNAPLRCPDCRQARKQQKMGQRQMFTITCAQCGKEDQVPFKPKGDRPVLCQECFRKSRGQV